MSKSIELEFVHKDLYGVALEVSKKFVSEHQARPILTYAFHAANGDLFATDSHRAIHIKDIHGFKEDYLVNPKNFMFAKGVYPDLNKVSSRENHKKAIVLNKGQIKLWLQLFKSMNNTLKMMKSSNRNKAATFTFKGKIIEAEVKVDSENSFKTILPTTELIVPEIKSISFATDFMRDALEAHFKLNSENLTIYLKGATQPIIMDDETRVKTLVLPIRNIQ